MQCMLRSKRQRRGYKGSTHFLGLPYRVSQIGWLQQQKCISSQVWSLEVQVQVLAGLISSKASVLDLQVCSPRVCTRPFLCVPLCPNLLLLGPQSIGLDSHYLKLITAFETPSPNRSRCEVLGVRTSTYELRGDTFSL